MTEELLRCSNHSEIFEKGCVWWLLTKIPMKTTSTRFYKYPNEHLANPHGSTQAQPHCMHHVWCRGSFLSHGCCTPFGHCCYHLHRRWSHHSHIVGDRKASTDPSVEVTQFPPEIAVDVNRMKEWKEKGMKSQINPISSKMFLFSPGLQVPGQNLFKPPTEWLMIFGFKSKVQPAKQNKEYPTNLYSLLLKLPQLTKIGTDLQAVFFVGLQLRF